MGRCIYCKKRIPSDLVGYCSECWWKYRAHTHVDSSEIKKKTIKE